MTPGTPPMVAVTTLKARPTAAMAESAQKSPPNHPPAAQMSTPSHKQIPENELRALLLKTKNPV